VNRPEMLVMWNLLVQSWGQKFAEQYGVTPNEAWQGMLTHVTPEAGRFAFQKALRETPTFPPTLGDFLAWVQEYRPEASRAISHDGYSRQATTEELRRNASADVSAFGSYRDYDKWRDTHTVKGKRPAHPEPKSPDWLYLHRLAWIDAAASNRRTTDAFGA